MYGSLRAVVPESQLVSTEHGLVPKGQGWFIVNAREMQWWERKGRGVLCEFEGAGIEGAADFLQLGINLTVLGPGEPMAMYHRETIRRTSSCSPGRRWPSSKVRSARLRQWDFVHCPPGTNHVIIGAEEGRAWSLPSAPATARGVGLGGVHRDEAAQRRGAGVERETTDSGEAYGDSREAS